MEYKVIEENSPSKLQEIVNKVGNNPLQRLTASFGAPFIAFFLSLLFCTLPMFILGILHMKYENIKEGKNERL